MKLFTMEHLLHVHPFGSVVEEIHETGHELKRQSGQAASPLLEWESFSASTCSYLSLGLPWQTDVRFVVWLALAVIYLLCGYSHSRLRRHYRDAPDRTPGVAW